MRRLSICLYPCHVRPTKEVRVSSPRHLVSYRSYKAIVWRNLTPRERLRRSWEMRLRLPDRRSVHARKLFPKP